MSFVIRVVVVSSTACMPLPPNQGTQNPCPGRETARICLPHLIRQLLINAAVRIKAPPSSPYVYVYTRKGLITSSSARKSPAVIRLRGRNKTNSVQRNEVWCRVVWQLIASHAAWWCERVSPVLAVITLPQQCNHPGYSQKCYGLFASVVLQPKLLL